MTVESGFEYIYLDWFPTHESKDTNLVSCFLSWFSPGCWDIKYYGTEPVRNAPGGKRPNLIFSRTFVAMDHFVPEYK